MKKIRIHNDIDVRWAVTTNGENVSLEGRNLSLSIENMFGRKEITDYTVVGNVVRFVFHGAEQRHTGLYVLVLQDITDGMRTVDKVQAFELVRHTIDQNGADDSNITTETVELTSDIIIGYDGKSAYYVAKANGFAGSEAEWLASLKGDKGEALTFDDLTEEQKAQLKGDKGEAFRYEDFTPEQVSALKGPKGDTGAQGDKGDNGDTGAQGPKGDTGAQGAKGDKGDKGEAFTYSDFTAEQIATLKGPKGDTGEAGYLHIVSHGTADTTYTISANEMHVWGEVTELNISLGANPDQTTVAEYAFKFTSGTTATTLTLPIDVTMPAGFVILPKHQYVMTVVFGMLEYWGTAL